MAHRQRDISVSEFFLKNRHLLGFDTPAFLKLARKWTKQEKVEDGENQNDDEHRVQ